MGVVEIDNLRVAKIAKINKLKKWSTIYERAA
jgi:hypothetical protein